jgi:hypothetical protein
MPATIIGNSEWTSRGLVLTAQNAQEQVNGLVNVQVEYTAPATKQQKIDQLFYVDSPPPIWPSVVNREEMLTNNLYMVTRSIERANGLVRVRAEYVSGLKRSGFRGYFLRETVETGKRGVAFNYRVGPSAIFTFDTGGATIGTIGISPLVVSGAILTPAPNSVLREVTLASGFIYDERIKTVEFVRIGGQSAVAPPIITRAEMASILQFNKTRFNFQDQVISDGPDNANQADVWRTFGTDEAYKAGLSSFERNTAIPFLESWDYVTPNVQIVTLTYRLTR